MTMTKHCSRRIERITHIHKEIGLGDVVCEKYVHTMRDKEFGYGGRYVYLTTTGVILVITEDKQTLITLYLATLAEAISMFKGYAEIPNEVCERIRFNETRYIENNKTIWH